MTHNANDDDRARFSLSRWSRRKRAIALADETVRRPQTSAVGTAAPPEAPAVGVSLPDVETLTFDSDFSVFMTTNVDASVRRAALKTLLHDPRFNVMDGLDVYIDDYTISDPIPASMLATLEHSVVAMNPVPCCDESAMEQPCEIAPGLRTPASAQTHVENPANGAQATIARESSRVTTADNQSQIPKADGMRASPALRADRSDVA